MKEQKQTKSPSLQLVEAVRGVGKDIYDKPIADDDPLLDVLQEVALDPDLLPDEEIKKLHRNERKYVSGLAEKVQLLIRRDAGEDLALEVDLLDGLRRGLGGLGIDVSRISGLAQKEVKEVSDRVKNESLLEDYVPTILPEHEARIDAIGQGEGRWTLRDTRVVATGFLDTYVATQKQLDSKAYKGEAKLDAIATVNAFSHAFVERLSGFSNDIQATGAINEVEEKIVSLLEERANDFQLKILAEHRQKGTLGDISEIKTLRTRVLSGVREEFITHKIMDEHKADLDVAAVAFSSIEEDVKEGWDLSLVKTSGETYYVDVKTSGAFSDLVNKGGKSLVVLEDTPGVALKYRYGASPVIVVAAGRLAGIRRDRNRLVVDHAADLVNGVKHGMNAIDNLPKE